MKKLFSAIAVLLFGAFSAIADDVADVKQTFIRFAQYEQAANIDAMASLYSKDYIGAKLNGDVLTYSQIQAMTRMLKTNDVKTFFSLFLMATENREPTAAELQQITARISPAQLAMLNQHLLNVCRKDGDLLTQTLKIIDIKVFKGKTARVVLEYTELDSADQTLQKTKKVKTITILRKENGTWKFLTSTRL